MASLTALAMLGFAGNSLLCRLALTQTTIDPASFTAIRLVSGALMLWLLAQRRGHEMWHAGNWGSALALFFYAAGFSFAYQGVSAASGALLLFGAVQLTMIGFGLYRGERLNACQVLGLLIALGALIGLLLPGLSTPMPFPAALMISAGIAWGLYSVRGRGAQNSTWVTAGNFIRTVPAAVVLMMMSISSVKLDLAGAGYGVVCGALTSALGYVIWYTALPSLRATTAAVVQLSVPVLATLGGAAILGEPMTQRVLLASAALLSGMALVIVGRRVSGPRRASISGSQRSIDG